MSTSTSNVRTVSEGIETVRPGRDLFIRHVQVGNVDNNSKRAQILAVHGLCASEQQYRPLWDAMQCPDMLLDCYSYDWMGCAQSPVLADANAFSRQETVADLVAIVKLKLDPSIPIVIMGHSYGPSIIIQSLLDGSDCIPLDYFGQIKGLIFMSTAVYDDNKDNNYNLINGGHPVMRNLPVFALRMIQPMLTDSFVKMAVHPENTNLAAAIKQASNGNDMRVAKNYHCSMQWSNEQELYTAANKLSKEQFMVIHGVDDQAIPHQGGQALAEKLGVNVVSVEKTSHLVMLERPDVVAELVLDFIKQRC